MAIIRSLVVKIKGDTSDLQKSLKKTSRELSKASRDIQSAGRSLTLGLTVPIAAAGVAATKLASDYEESLNKVNVVFQENSKNVEAWSRTTLKQFGIAKGTALDMASLYGDMATSMGLPVDASAEMSKSLVGLAGDISSFKNVSLSQSSNALKGIFTGETESLKNLGIVMTQANLQAFAMSKGIEKNIQDMTESEKVALRYGYVIEKSTNAIGDFARTGGGTANQFRVFTESLKELGQTLGSQILPVITPLIKRLNELVQSFAALSPEQQKAILTALALAAALGPIIFIAGKLTGIVGILIGNFGAFIKVIRNGGGVIAALKALIGPVGITVLAIAAIAEVVYVVWKTFDSFKTFIKAVWAVIVADVDVGVKNFIAFIAYLNYKVNDLIYDMSKGVIGHVADMLFALGKIPKIGDEFETAARKVEGLKSKLSGNALGAKSDYELAQANVVAAAKVRSEAFKDLVEAASAWGGDVGDTFGGQIEGIKNFFSGIKDMFSGSNLDMPDLSIDESTQVNWQDFLNGMDNGLIGIEDAATGANSALEGMVDTVRTLVDEIRSQTRSFAEFVGLFDKAEKKFVSGESLLRRLKGQIITMKQWQQDLLTLQNKGVSSFLLNELRSMGPGSASEIAGLARLSTDKLKEYESLYSQKYGIAGQQAAASVGFSRSAEKIIESQIIVDVTGNYVIGNRDIDDLTDKIIYRLRAAGVTP